MAITFKHHQLPSGLEIIGEVDPEAHTAALGIFVRTGSRDEPSELMGVSHFLEHMMFKGTASRTADQINQHFDDIGAVHNAFTSHEMTAFWAHLLPEYLEQAEDVLADMLQPALREDDFNLERGVILEEIAMYEDEPFWVLYEQLMERYYHDHPMKHRVLGTKATITDLTRDAMHNYFREHYATHNMVVAYSGNVDFDAAVARLTQRTSQWSQTSPSRAHPDFERGEGSLIIESEKVNRTYLLMANAGPAVQSSDRHAVSMLNAVLGDSDGSRLYWALIDTGLADEAMASYDGRDGMGEQFMYATCSEEQADEVQEIMLREAKHIADSLTEDDLERVRSKVATSVILAGERPAGRMRRLGHVWMYFNEYISLDEELARIQAVTIKDMHQAAEAWPLSPRLIGRLRPVVS
ncbi:MAG: M16 family metallopeptidase [Phycisphaerales bacterium]